MATNRRQRKEDSKSTIPLSRPNTTVSDSTRETLLDIAAKRGILKSQAEEGESQDEEIVTGRAADAMLWSMSLAMLHFTLDVLVHHQYAMTIEYNVLGSRFLQAFAIFFLLFYTFHRHPDPSLTLPNILPNYQSLLHQALFFIISVASGCCLIHITNKHAYIAIMKRAPVLGCLWIWSVIELDLWIALPSLLVCVGFLKIGGYAFT